MATTLQVTKMVRNAVSAFLADDLGNYEDQDWYPVDFEEGTATVSRYSFEIIADGEPYHVTVHKPRGYSKP